LLFQISIALRSLRSATPPHAPPHPIRTSPTERLSLCGSREWRETLVAAHAHTNLSQRCGLLKNAAKDSQSLLSARLGLGVLVPSGVVSSTTTGRCWCCWCCIVAQEEHPVLGRAEGVVLPDADDAAWDECRTIVAGTALGRSLRGRDSAATALSSSSMCLRKYERSLSAASRAFSSDASSRDNVSIRFWPSIFAHRSCRKRCCCCTSSACCSEMCWRSLWTSSSSAADDEDPASAAFLCGEDAFLCGEGGDAGTLTGSLLPRLRARPGAIVFDGIFSWLGSHYHGILPLTLSLLLVLFTVSFPD
jgi:hypothetical protein